GRPVEVILDGNPLATLTTADDGSFEIVVPAKRAGPHVLAVVASRGGYLEATSGTLRFRAVSAPLAVTSLALSGSALSWRLPTPDEDRPIQEVRVYAQSPGEPWRKVATLPPDAAAFDASQASGARSFGVVALNVAGESPWATVSR
ncbi:MAG TPA: hypothetical protein VHH36_04385, partial [Candidatus Thermoplasmatota archaeon]|nr:hypothetical protein [Candidatus Thermoplasmatota archaeon]